MADNNPNPETNPKLKRICEQLGDVRDQIMEDMNSAALADDWAEVARLSSLDDRAVEIMRKIGCGGIAIVSPLDQLLVNASNASNAPVGKPSKKTKGYE